MKTLLLTGILAILSSLCISNSNFETAFNLKKEGDKYAAQGDLGHATMSYLRAIHEYPAYGSAHYNLALVYFELEDYSRAAKAGKEALTLLPGSASLTFLVGNAYLKLGEVRNGLEYLNRAVALDPSYSMLVEEAVKSNNYGEQEVEVLYRSCGAYTDKTLTVRE